MDGIVILQLCYIPETAQASAKVTIEREYEVICDL